MLIASKQEQFAGDAATAELQQRTRWLQSLYERHAYLVYNLALCITCAPEPARAAAEQAFMGQLDASEDELTTATARAALGNARGHRASGGAGGPDEDELLHAMATLTPSERAALALADLDGADPDAIASALKVDSSQAATLLERARA